MKRSVQALNGAVAALLLSLGAVGAAEADPLASPAMSASLSANPSPAKFDAGPLGQVYVTGVVSGLGFATTHKVGEDRIDVSNALINLQTTEGPVQFFVQAGAYSYPTVGFAYGKASDTVKNTYGLVPQAYVKYVANEHLNFQVGKMQTIIGAEYGNTFQNLNIQRGLLWFQENVNVNSAQVNFSSGPISGTVSLNDGFYSKKFNWLSGLLAYNMGGGNTLTLVAGGNLGKTAKSGPATPLESNNSAIYNVIFTHAAGPWTISPYFQYSHVPNIPSLGIGKGSTTGAALLVNYKFSDMFSLAGRGEYSGTKGAPAFQYSPGADAWSLTVTPTWQFKTFFIRGEAAYSKVSDFARGTGFGPAGDRKDQLRLLIETGVLF